jgi:hypothetical protein
MTTIDASGGGYSYIPGVFQYSAGVSALPGFRIERVRFSRPVPLREGFALAARIIESAGRPLTAFCACELRSPAPFTEAGFRAFNEGYVSMLVDWGVVKDGVNPVARSNVCPDVDPPAEPGFHAFAFTTVAAKASPSFVIAGSGEVPEGMANYRDHIVRRGDLSPEGLRDKARWVLGEMERRMAAFGMSWQQTTAVQLYTVHDVYPFLRDELVRRGTARHGLTWHFDRPPIVDIEYEMDCRAVDTERVFEV